MKPSDTASSERDERLGEAIEAYLALAESGDAPDPDSYASQYPDLSDELREALDGLAVLQGLVGSESGPPGSALRSGRRIAGYRIVRELGRGGMGVVYEAVHVDLDRPVALKVLGPHHAPQSSGRKRFLNEAKTAASLHHTHIVPVFDVGQMGGLCYYAMQRIEGCGLDRLIRLMRRGRPDASGAPASKTALPRPGDATASWHGDDEAMPAGPTAPAPDDPPAFTPPPGNAYYRWVAQLGQHAADALDYAHHRGVIHRDIKPSNLLVDRRGMVWVADFGLARRDVDQAITQTGAPLGTPRYMSPEQAMTAPVDPRTDVFSLGSTLYELLTLRPAFDGANTVELIQQISTRDPVPPCKIDSRIPRDLETIVLKAMSKRPADRYARAADLAEDLSRYQEMMPVRARRIGPIGRFSRFARRHPFSSTIAITAASIVLAVATWAHLSVLSQRNEAQRARKDAEQALAQTQEAIKRSEAARARQLWSEASLIRKSAMPNGRSEGLQRIREAASLIGSDSDLRVPLRDEAIELLSERDLEAGPTLPTGRIWGLTFAAEGSVLATLDEAGTTLSLQDLRSGVLHEPRLVRLSATPAQIGDDDAARRSPFRGDGPRPGSGVVAVGPWLAVIEPGHRNVSLIVPETGARFAELAISEGRRIESLIATPDGRRLITLESTRRDEDGPERSSRPSIRAVLWDPARPERPIATLAEPQPEPDVEPTNGRGRRWVSIPLVGASLDSKTLAVTWLFGGEIGAPILIVDAETGTEQGRIEDVPGPVTALAVGPEGLVAAAIADGTVRFWDDLRPSSMLGLSHQQSWVNGLKFSPDGTLLALTGSSAGIELWETGTNTLVALARMGEKVADFAFNPDGRTLAASAGEVTQLWSIVEPMGRHRLSGFETRPVAIGFDAEGNTLAVTPWSGSSRLWRIDHPACTAPALPIDRAISQAFVGPATLVLGRPEGFDIYHIDPPSLLRHISWDEIDPAPEPPPNRRPSSSAVGLVAGVAWVGSAEPLRRPPPMPDRRMPASWTPLAGSPRAEEVVIGRGAQLYLWTRPQSEMPRPIRIADISPEDANDRRQGRRGRSPWLSLVLESGSRRLYATNLEGVLQAWDLADGGSEVVARPLAWSGRYQGIRFITADGPATTLVAVDGRGRVQRIDTATGILDEPLALDPAQAVDRATAIALSADGQLLAVGFQQGGISLWQRGPNAVMQPLMHLPGHRGAAGLLSFDPSGRRLASTGDDKSVQVWELDRIGAELSSLRVGW